MAVAALRGFYLGHNQLFGFGPDNDPGIDARIIVGPNEPNFT